MYLTSVSALLVSLPGDRRWPAPPAGSSCTWTAPCSGLTRCSHKWAPPASAAPASLRETLHPPSSCAPRLLSVTKNTQTACRQERLHKYGKMMTPPPPFSQSSICNLVLPPHQLSVALFIYMLFVANRDKCSKQYHVSMISTFCPELFWWQFFNLWHRSARKAVAMGGGFFSIKRFLFSFLIFHDFYVVCTDVKVNRGSEK